MSFLKDGYIRDFLNQLKIVFFSFTNLTGAAGFGTVGVGAGTVAAAIHSLIGNVAAGSVFAACQSAGKKLSISF